MIIDDVEMVDRSGSVVDVVMTLLDDDHIEVLAKRPIVFRGQEIAIRKRDSGEVVGVYTVSDEWTDPIVGRTTIKGVPLEAAQVAIGV